MAAQIFVGAVGVTIRLRLGINLEAAGAAAIRWKKPDGTTGSWVATVVDGPAGIIAYTTTAASDLDQAGIWAFNSEWNPNSPAADIFYGRTACLEIFALFDCEA